MAWNSQWTRNRQWAGIAFAAVLLSLLVSACTLESPLAEKSARAFYHWRAVYQPGTTEQQYLKDLHINKLYLKLFDVTLDEQGRPQPVAQLQPSPDSSFSPGEIIPVVFITNETLQAVDSLQTDQLARDIARLINALLRQHHLGTAAEWQIDCDWTTTTRNRYFQLLQTMRSQQQGTRFSATIRLHQVKFRNKAGVPPVERGMLMCYNMGNLQDTLTRNSILDVQELMRYTASLSEYPLPLDAVFPVFNWTVLYHHGHYAGLLPFITLGASSPSLSARDPFAVVTKDTVIAGYRLVPGDLLRPDGITPDELQVAAQHIAARLPGKAPTIAFFHLDTATIKRYPTHELETVFQYFD